MIHEQSHISFFTYFCDCVRVKEGESGIQTDKMDIREDPEIEILELSLKWRQRISYNFTEVLKLAEWESLRLRMLDPFMRLYKKFIVYEGFLLIAHRKYISVF